MFILYGYDDVIKDIKSQKDNYHDITFYISLI